MRNKNSKTDVVPMKLLRLLVDLLLKIISGHITTIHLQLFLQGKNPFDPLLYALAEWRTFYKEVFNIGIDIEHISDWEHPSSNSQIVYVSKKLPLVQLLNRWDAYTIKFFTKRIPISFTDYYKDSVNAHKYVVNDGIARSYVATFGQLGMSEERFVKIIDGTKEDVQVWLSSAYGARLQEILLHALFTYWKYGYFTKTPFRAVCVDKLTIQPMADENSIAVPVVQIYSDRIFVLPTIKRALLDKNLKIQCMQVGQRFEIAA